MDVREGGVHGSAAATAPEGRILAVDDTPANLRLLMDILTGQFYTVHPATSGQAALRFLETTLPDLILLDVLMPDMDGYQLCARLKADERTREIPVIFISAASQPFDKVKAFQHGCVDYVVKPFQAEEVLARIRTHLALRSLQKRLEQHVEERTAELRQANARLNDEIAERRRAEARVRRLVDANIIGIVFFDTHGRIMEANDAFLHLVGYSRADLLSDKVRWRDITPPEHTAVDDRALEEIRRTGSCTPFEKEYLHKDGTRVPVLIGGAVFERSPDEGVAFVLDLTERKRAEQELQRLGTALEERNAQLEQANRRLLSSNAELQRFTSVVAHDLKAPLRAVHSLSTWIEEELSGHMPDETRPRMQLLRARVRHMDHLINALLDYSRAGGEAVPVETVCAADAVAEVLRTHEVPEGFSVALPRNLPCLTTDRIHLQQVFANLIGNAIAHHDRPDGHVWVSSRDLGAHYEFSVEDDGPGIPPEYHERIFEMFQRVDPSKDAGTGIGLAVVKKVVENTGGQVRLESRPGRGTAFRFTWPKVIPPEGRSGPS